MESIPTWIAVLLTLISFIVVAAVYIAARPTRSEVDKMIDIKVNQRFDALEDNIKGIQNDIKTLLKRRR
ncbi:MAG: hypothetical protein KBG83_00150 [Bacteroidetes bacterium]|nr:hypothetical protein [Bacteroidota bacterium]